MSSAVKTSPVVATLLARTPPPPLSFSSKWRPELSEEIDSLKTSVNVRAVLHLLNDDFDGCHNLVQTQEDNSYSCNLHSIVHRREPDYWNSTYWIAQCTHPHMPVIYGPTVTSSVSQAQKAAEAFVDRVQYAASSKTGIEKVEAEQWEEMTQLARLLLEFDDN